MLLFMIPIRIVLLTGLSSLDQLCCNVMGWTNMTGLVGVSYPIAAFHESATPPRPSENHPCFPRLGGGEIPAACFLG